MWLKDILNQINVLFPKPVVHTGEDDKAMERFVVSMHAQGTVALHEGRYITSDEIKRRKDKIASHDFRYRADK